LKMQLLLLLPLLGLVHAQRPLHDAPPQSNGKSMFFTLERRGGPFPTMDIANMTFLAEVLRQSEARFNLTERAMQGNKVVRVPKNQGEGGPENHYLMAEAGRVGNW
jgi:hypothetical protein